jgi:hypothetical protein
MRNIRGSGGCAGIRPAPKQKRCKIRGYSQLPKGVIMTRNLRPKHAILSILFIFIALPGTLSACSPIAETPKSTEGVNYDLTLTVENSATEELTLVPETEVATATQTWTLTSEPSPTATATATETPKPTEVEKYPIDLEKLRNFPQSYEYLVAHPEEFVEAPNPLEDIDVFNQWWNEKFIPILGDRSEREKNMIMRGGGVLGDFFDISNSEDQAMPLQGQPEMLFFKHEGVTYPIAIINVGYEEDPHANYTMAIILIKEDELKAIKSLNNGDKITMMRIYIMEKSNLPEVFKKLIAAGIKGEFSEENKLIFGPGLIITLP